MTTKLKVVLAQLNLHVGDIEGNVKKHIEAANIARDKHHADLIIFPELSITGYPPEDLLLRKSFVNDSMDAADILMHEIQGIHALIGHPFSNDEGCFNACSLIYNGKLLGRYTKECLPNYGVFDEHRYFISNALLFCFLAKKRSGRCKDRTRDIRSVNATLYQLS